MESRFKPGETAYILSFDRGYVEEGVVNPGGLLVETVMVDKITKHQDIKGEWTKVHFIHKNKEKGHEQIKRQIKEKLENNPGVSKLLEALGKKEDFLEYSAEQEERGGDYHEGAVFKNREEVEEYLRTVLDKTFGKKKSKSPSKSHNPKKNAIIR